MARGASGRMTTALALLRGGGIPWPARDAGDSPAALIRRHGRRAILAAFPPVTRPLAAVLMALAWPVAAARRAWAEAGRVEPSGQRARRAWAAWTAALRHNIPPTEFFAYRLDDRGSPAPDAWVYDREIVWLLRRLTAVEAARLAHDKRAFATFCRDRQLPHVPLLPGAAEGAAPDLPAVVLKPRRGANARGVAVWRRTGTGWSDGLRPPLPWAGALARAEAEHGEVIAQPLVQPHPALARFPGEGAAAARLVTGAWREGSVELLQASFAVPPAGAASSNAGARRRVDLRDGRCLPLGEGRLHPVWGPAEALPDDLPEGFELPCWEAARALVLRAHRAFPAPAVLLGWDVAFTPQGPVLIECNVAVSFFLEQMETLVPAGESRAAALVASWLR